MGFIDPSEVDSPVMDASNSVQSAIPGAPYDTSPELANWAASTSSSGKFIDPTQVDPPSGNWYQQMGSGVLGGLGSLADVVSSTFNPNAIVPPSQALNAGFDAVTGVPKSTQIGSATLPYKIGNYLPAVLGGSESLVGDGIMGAAKTLASILGSDVTSATGGYFGNKLGGAPGELLGAVLGGSVPSALEGAIKAPGAILKAFSEDAAQQSAKDSAVNIVKKFVDPNELIQAVTDSNAAQQQIPYIQRQSQNFLPNFQRTAEITQLPGAAALEQAAIRTNPDLASAATAQDAAREVARQNIYEALAGPAQNTGDLGNTIRAGLESNMKDAGQTVKDLAAKSFLGDEELKTYPTKTVVSTALNQFTKSGARKISSDFQNLVDNFRSLPPRVDLQTLQDYRSAFGNYAGGGGIGSNTIEKMTAEIAGRMRSAIDTGIQKSAEAGEIPQSQASNYYKMIAARASKGATFEQGAVGDVLEKKPLGAGYEVGSTDVAGKLLNSPEDAQQAIAALKGQNTSVKALRSSLLQDVWNRSTNPLTEEFNPTGFSRQLRMISGIDDPVLTKPQINGLNKIANDLKSQAAVKTLGIQASKGQSATAQFNSTLELLQNSVKSEASSTVQKALNNVHPLLGKIYQTVSSIVSDPAARQLLINKELAKFVLNPKDAVDLLKAPTPKQLGTLLPKFLNQLSTSIVAGSGAIENKKNDTNSKIEPTAPDNKKTTSIINNAMNRAEVKMQDPNQQTLLGFPKEKLLDSFHHVESNDGKKTLSPAGAIGDYQFEPATAKQLGFDPTDKIASRAGAAKYLTMLGSEFKDPKLGILGYNWGPGHVADALKKFGVTTYDQLLPHMIDTYKKTQNPKLLEAIQYVPKILSGMSNV